MKMILLGFSLAGLLTSGALALRRPPPLPRPGYSRAGRDRALVRQIRAAQATIYLRTRRFTLVPVANELLQALQDGRAVRLELPLGEAHHPGLIQVLMEHGAVVELSSEPVPAYEGTYLLVDDRQVLYSAAPLDHGIPGVPRSYMEGVVR